MTHYLEGRLFEWTMALTLILLGTELLAWPDTVQAHSFRYAVWAFRSDNVAALFLLLGLARTAALVANGRSYVYGPRVRAFGALIGALIWSQMFVSLLMLLPRSSAPSPGLPVWFILTLGELYSSYRAATDVRTGSKHT